MRARIFTGRLRRAALLGMLGATLAVLTVPFIGASGASAYPGFTVSVTCTATNSWAAYTPEPRSGTGTMAPTQHRS